MTEFRHSSVTSKKRSFPMTYPLRNTIGSALEIQKQTKESSPKNLKTLCFGFLTPCYHCSQPFHSIVSVISTYKMLPVHLQRMTLWEWAVGLPSNHQLFGSVKLGLGLNSFHSLLYTKTFRDTSHLGKLWPSFVLYSSFTKNVNHVQDLSTSHQDHTIQVQKLTSIMVSPLLKSFLRIKLVSMTRLPCNTLQCT